MPRLFDSRRAITVCTSELPKCCKSPKIDRHDNQSTSTTRTYISPALTRCDK
eukprot:jgi/Bigna1/59589/fgenesh1_kg.5_\